MLFGFVPEEEVVRDMRENFDRIMLQENDWRWVGPLYNKHKSILFNLGDMPENLEQRAQEGEFKNLTYGELFSQFFIYLMEDVTLLGHRLRDDTDFVEETARAHVSENFKDKAALERFYKDNTEECTKAASNLDLETAEDNELNEAVVKVFEARIQKEVREMIETLYDVEPFDAYDNPALDAKLDKLDAELEESGYWSRR